jgi:hypothetical protein
MAFERFCIGPTATDLLLPLEQRPMTSNLGLDEVEEAWLCEFLFAE